MSAKEAAGTNALAALLVGAARTPLVRRERRRATFLNCILAEVLFVLKDYEQMRYSWPEERVLKD